MWTFFKISHLQLLKSTLPKNIPIYFLLFFKTKFVPIVALTQWSKQAAILLNATALILLVKVDFGKKTLWLNDKVFLMRPASAMTKISVGWHISLMISHGKT